MYVYTRPACEKLQNSYHLRSNAVWTWCLRPPPPSPGFPSNRFLNTKLITFKTKRRERDNNPRRTAVGTRRNVFRSHYSTYGGRPDRKAARRPGPRQPWVFRVRLTHLVRGRVVSRFGINRSVFISPRRIISRLLNIYDDFTVRPSSRENRRTALSAEKSRTTRRWTYNVLTRVRALICGGGARRGDFSLAAIYWKIKNEKIYYQFIPPYK